MDGIKLAEEIKRLGDLLEKLPKVIKERMVAVAEATAKLEQETAKETLILRDGGESIGLIPTLVKGRVSQLRLSVSLAEAELKCATYAFSACSEKKSGYQTIFKKMEEM